jgi:RNA polymerase sigma factor (sigma-70 family)
MARTWTDCELYQACGQNGSEEQRAAFVYLHQELYALSLFMLQTAVTPEPNELAADCAQEALVKIWKNLHTCQQPDSFRNWAKKIVRNHTLNEIARLKRKQEEALEAAVDHPLQDPQSIPMEAFERAERYGALLDLLRHAPISERSRYVILAKYLLQLNDEEISKALSDREGAMIRPSHVQVTRAKNFKKMMSDPTFRQILQKWQDESP